MQVGLLTDLKRDHIYDSIKHTVELGFRSGQISVWDMELYNDDTVLEVKRACSDFDFRISAVWCGWSGPVVWCWGECEKEVTKRDLLAIYYLLYDCYLFDINNINFFIIDIKRLFENTSFKQYFHCAESVTARNFADLLSLIVNVMINLYLFAVPLDKYFVSIYRQFCIVSVA